MKRITGLLLLMSLFLSCGKEVYNIPDVPVNYNVTLVEFGIKAVNNILVVPNNGVAGLIIIRKPDGYYAAFDRCSTVNPDKKCSVNPDDSGFTATDPCSGAMFSLLDGSPQKAPAVRNLKTYRISLNGNLLHVTN